MKKILFGAAIAAMAGAAYAAAITWESNTLYTLDDSGAFTDTKANNKSGWQGYVWLIDQNTYQTLADKYATDKNFDAVINAYKGQTGEATANGAIPSRKSSITMETTITETGTYYAALLYKYGESGYYIGNLASAVVDNADTPPTIMSTGSLPFGDPAYADAAFTGGSTGASTPVVPDDPVDGPEPTSALLLLIGGSMLALKRKNA